MQSKKALIVLTMLMLLSVSVVYAVYTIYSDTKTVTVSEYVLSLNVYAVGRDVVLNGTLIYQGLGVSNVSVVLMHWNVTGNVMLDTISTVNTNGNGNYTYSFTEASVGVKNYKASASVGQ